MNKLAKDKLKIEGMHCTSCAINIDFDLEDLDGVEKAVTNYARRETVVEYDKTQTSLKKIISTIKETGYVAIPSND